jgi:aspartate/methionine/tyrosine aminotransferase
LVQAFFIKYFKPYYPLEESHIFAQTGAGASVNHLIMGIADVGEYCMIPVLYYGAFDADVGVHTGVKIYEVCPHSLESMSVDGKELDRAYLEAKSQGKSITSLLVTNPDNPLGR